ncbi:MAG: GMP synthase (glutamine-hydrolyzing) [Microgenomates bacterium OLB23]|nr:MAG: GMP synthase (glutamine-hydrolyzing) [Microgenomates bacterium OLB23]
MIGVLQSRTDASGWHELKCIYESLGVLYSDILVCNIANPRMQKQKIVRFGRSVDAIIIGGLGEVGYGERNKLKKAAFDRMRKETIPALRTLIKEEKPMLGICFGHQLISEALHEEVVHDPERAEVGIRKVYLYAEALHDPVFKGLKGSFETVMAHKDRVVAFPKDVVPLAYSHECMVQAYRYKNMVYAVQFHPEMTEEDYNYRLSFNSSYLAKADKGMIHSHHLQGRRLLRNFINIVAST